MYYVNLIPVSEKQLNELKMTRIIYIIYGKKKFIKNNINIQLYKIYIISFIVQLFSH